MTRHHHYLHHHLGLRFCVFFFFSFQIHIRNKFQRMYQRRRSRDNERSRCLDLSFFESLFSSRKLLLSLLRYL